MIFFAVALSIEARPIIQHFELKKTDANHPFDIWETGCIKLIITGIGNHHMLAGLSYLCGLYPEKHPIFINYGVAAHPSLAIGSLISPISITYKNEQLYPCIFHFLNHHMAPIYCVDRPLKNLPEHMGVDMESYGFFTAVKLFTFIEHALCIKVISDHGASSHKQIDKQTISAYLHQHIDTLCEATKQLVSKEDKKMRLEMQMDHLHLSKTQTIQINRLIHQLSLLNVKSSEVQCVVDRSRSAKQAIDTLQSILRKQRVSL